MIDIIIPTIDHPKYLDRALTSIENFCNPNNISIYIVNDNSKYDSSLYENIIKQHSSLTVCYIVSPTSEGPGPSRNKGIRAGYGEYIVFLDCDDVFIDDVEKYCDFEYDFFTTKTNNPNDIFCSTSTDNPFSPIHGMGIKRAFLEKYNLYFPNVKYGGEDTIFRCCCMMISSNYKQHPDSTYYSYQVRGDSNFTHRVIRKPRIFSVEEERQLLSYHHNTAWFAQFLSYLFTLHNIEALMVTHLWNDKLLEILLMFHGPYYASTSQEGLFFSIVTIKKFVNINYVSKQGIENINEMAKQHILMLYLFNQYFSLEDNILAFSPNDDYEEFFHINQEMLPNIVLQTFCFSRPQFFDWKSSLNLWCNYYYNDIFH